MAALGAKKYRWPLAEIDFKPTTRLKPCSDFGPWCDVNLKQLVPLAASSQHSSFFSVDNNNFGGVILIFSYTFSSNNRENKMKNAKKKTDLIIWFVIRNITWGNDYFSIDLHERKSWNFFLVCVKDGLETWQIFKEFRRKKEHQTNDYRHKFLKYIKQKKFAGRFLKGAFNKFASRKTKSHLWLLADAVFFYFPIIKA